MYDQRLQKKISHVLFVWRFWKIPSLFLAVTRKLNFRRAKSDIFPIPHLLSVHSFVLFFKLIRIRMKLKLPNVLQVLPAPATKEHKFQELA